MEYVAVSDSGLTVSRVALGTWAIGGWMWGGTDEDESVRTIHAALDKGVNLVDTAPVYGFGRSEEIVGKAVEAYGREKVHISTKCGLNWTDDGQVFRDSRAERIRKEIDDSLERLRTDYLDIYYIHWPDPLVPFGETAAAMRELLGSGKIRAVGVSNYSPAQMDAFREACPLHLSQPPYNIFEREIEDDILPYCNLNNISLMTYGALCRGLLSGGMRKDREFKGDDLRKVDPKFEDGRFEQYLDAAHKLGGLARESHGKELLPLAVRWILDQGVEIALWGGRRPDQMEPIPELFGWNVNEGDKRKIDAILSEAIKDPVGPEFMAPPSREELG